MPSSPEIIDISRPLQNSTACWPGDEPFSFRLSWKMADGSTVNVGAIQASVHTATHCDSPFHYDDQGPKIEQLPLDTFIGPAHVVDVRDTTRWRERVEQLDFSETPRVLFHTGGWPDTSVFPDPIPVMELDLPDWLADRGVRLIGVDVPSVDGIHSKTLEIHHALKRRGILIVEGLWLNDVPVGRYEFVGLPLKIVGGDGSPLRAVLRIGTT
ncbi:MAG: arylformamidase [Gemmataceae bacterium]|nr:arylformamidase [Gemmataceae bacterium]